VSREPEALSRTPGKIKIGVNALGEIVMQDEVAGEFVVGAVVQNEF